MNKNKKYKLNKIIKINKKFLKENKIIKKVNYKIEYGRIINKNFLNINFL